MSKLTFAFSALFAVVLASAGIVEAVKGNRDAIYVVPFIIFSAWVAWRNYRKMKEEDREELFEIRERQKRLAEDRK
jgi:hypothetical protein